MECKGCGSNFRTISTPNDVDRICYKCNFNNGSKDSEDQLNNNKEENKND